MAEEEEIDILSDFSLDILLQKSETEIFGHNELDLHRTESLRFDCSAPWLSNHTGTSFWDGSDNFDNTELPQTHWYTLSDNVSHPSTSSDITDDSGWTKTERNLLSKGIENFGRNSTRLARFIGSKTSSEVKKYLKTFNSYTQTVSTMCNKADEEIAIEGLENIKHGSDSLILDDTQIPSSIEEVVAVVTTAVPTIPRNSFKYNRYNSKTYKEVKKGNRNYCDRNSVLKRNVANLLKYKNNRNLKQIGGGKKKIGDTKRINISADKQNTSGKRKRYKKKIFGMSDIQESSDEAQAGSNVNDLPSLNGEEVVTMTKENSASDVEINIEDPQNTVNERPPFEVLSLELVGQSIREMTRRLDIIHNQNQRMPDDAALSSASVEALEELVTADVPSCELLLESNNVSDFEKLVNRDFFRGGSTKTPEGYLKIRNHILSMWSTSKPAYVTITSAIDALTHCGDVNSIGRIHLCLEQIGAINFGCTEINYMRPLCELFFGSTVGDKPSDPPPVLALLKRCHLKRRFINDGGGGCTLIHDENGKIVDSYVINEEPATKSKHSKKSPTVKLFVCQSFNEEHPQPFSIHLHVTALLLMDFHAHISRTEVMGLIGGHWDADAKQMLISRYVACQNIDPSTTHCDMCPVSQATATDIIESGGLTVLGWFHSHPTFAAEPSKQDLDTQLAAQRWIGANSRPHIGLILSPFSESGELTASLYSCFTVDKKADNQYISHKYKTELVSSNLNIIRFVNEARQIYNKNLRENPFDKIDLEHAYIMNTSISYFDKFISSVKMHLEKCTDVNELNRASIISAFKSVCLNKT